MIKKEYRLTLKERGWLKEYISNGGNATRAALAVYDTKDYLTAGLIGHENLNKHKIQDELGFWLEKKGLFDGQIAQNLVDGTKATKFFSSHTEADKEVPDWQARAKFNELVLKVKNKFPKENEQNVNVGFNVLINGN